MKFQLEIDFNPPKETFHDCIRRTVYGCGKQLKYIAADIDMSPAELSRKLADNHNDPIHFPVDKLPELIKTTEGKDIVYWLVNEFLRDKDRGREQVLSQVMELLPKLKPLLEALEPKGVKI